jgi:riboflavin kinase/FMN adenylyltransferase
MRIVPGVAGFGAAAQRPTAAPLAVAIGNFDGVHLGHAALLAEARARAARRGAESAVLTFMPHPARLFAPERAPPLIMSLERRLELVAEAGIDVAIVQPFTRDFAAIDAPAFVRDVLARDLGARDAVVGYDFSFGRDRSGNAAMLGALGAAVDLEVAVIPPISIAGQTCSSSRIRALVQAGDTGAAASLLGRPFELEGAVVRGAGRGRELGFPTANVAVPARACLPADGIYAGTYVDATAVEHPCAISLGRRPTFYEHADHSLLEAYLLDFSGDLYGQTAKVRFVERIRAEARFDSAEELVAQMGRDVEAVRVALGA